MHTQWHKKSLVLSTQVLKLKTWVEWDLSSHRTWWNLIMIRIITKAIFCEVEIIISGEKLALAGRQCNLLPNTAERERERKRGRSAIFFFTVVSWGIWWQLAQRGLSFVIEKISDYRETKPTRQLSDSGADTHEIVLIKNQLALYIRWRKERGGFCATYAKRSFSSKQEREGLSQFVNRMKSGQIFVFQHMDFSYFNNEQMSSPSTVEALSSVYLFASMPAQTIREFSYWLLFNRKPCAFTLCWAEKQIWHGWTSNQTRVGEKSTMMGKGSRFLIGRSPCASRRGAIAHTDPRLVLIPHRARSHHCFLSVSSKNQ